MVLSQESYYARCGEILLNNKLEFTNVNSTNTPSMNIEFHCSITEIDKRFHCFNIYFLNKPILPL